MICTSSEARPQENILENTRTVSTTKHKNKKEVIFPQNPLEFAPNGLRKIVRSGSTNGQIIQWISGKYTIFEWDENKQHGAHYHVMSIVDNNRHIGIHYRAGDRVPEPYASILSN